MRIRWKTTTLAFGVCWFLAVLAPNAYASTPSPLNGTFSATIAPVASRSADGNTFISFTFNEIFTGTISGTRVGEGTLVVHPDGTFNARDAGLFTGTIGGAPGTATLAGDITGVFGFSLEARFVVSDGAGGLAGVHAEGSAAGSPTGPLSFAGTYSGLVESSAP